MAAIPDPPKLGSIGENVKKVGDVAADIATDIAKSEAVAWTGRTAGAAVGGPLAPVTGYIGGVVAGCAYGAATAAPGSRTLNCVIEAVGNAIPAGGAVKPAMKEAAGITLKQTAKEAAKETAETAAKKCTADGCGPSWLARVKGFFGGEPPPPKKVDPPQKALTHGAPVARSADPADDGARFLVKRSGFAANRVYGELAEVAVRDAGDKLARGEFKSLAELNDFLAARRGEIARTLGDPDAAIFGVRRTEEFGASAMTPIVGRYAYVAERADAFAPPGDFGIRGLVLDINGTKVPSTAVLDARSAYGRTWMHTSAHSIEPIMNHAETLFQRAMNPKLSVKESLETVGELHFYSAHAMPYARGSAAVSDMTSRAILDAKGIKSGPWKDGIVPDIEALVSNDAKKFGREYGTMFEQLPTKVDP